MRCQRNIHTCQAQYLLQSNLEFVLTVNFNKQLSSSCLYSRLSTLLICWDVNYMALYQNATVLSFTSLVFLNFFFIILFKKTFGDSVVYVFNIASVWCFYRHILIKYISWARGRTPAGRHLIKFSYRNYLAKHHEYLEIAFPNP